MIHRLAEVEGLINQPIINPNLTSTDDCCKCCLIQVEFYKEKNSTKWIRQKPEITNISCNTHVFIGWNSIELQYANIEYKYSCCKIKGYHWQLISKNVQILNNSYPTDGEWTLCDANLSSTYTQNYFYQYTRIRYSKLVENDCEIYDGIIPDVDSIPSQFLEISKLEDYRPSSYPPCNCFESHFIGIPPTPDFGDFDFDIDDIPTWSGKPDPIIPDCENWNCKMVVEFECIETPSENGVVRGWRRNTTDIPNHNLQFSLTCEPIGERWEEGNWWMWRQAVVAKCDCNGEWHVISTGIYHPLGVTPRNDKVSVPVEFEVNGQPGWTGNGTWKCTPHPDHPDEAWYIKYFKIRLHIAYFIKIIDTDLEPEP